MLVKAAASCWSFGPSCFSLRAQGLLRHLRRQPARTV